MTSARDGSHTRTALIGLDGATFRILDPLIQAGAMPALGALQKRGARAILRSTTPTYTPPAWVSMATGVNPGRHGVFGFLSSTPQERPQIAHSGLIDAPAMWEYLGGLNVRAGIFNVPMSYPPVPVNGFMISGGLAAGWTDSDMPNFASDVATGRIVTELAGGHYPLDTVVSYERDWSSPTVAPRIEAVQRMRRRVLMSLLERTDPDLVFAVFEGPDRLQHLHYQYIVECSDWYSRPEAGRFRDGAVAYFAEVDRAIADLVAWAGSGGNVIVVSDHGFGSWEKTVNLNLLLERWGYLQLPSVSRLTRSGAIAGPGQRMARKVVPRRLLHALKAQVGRGIVWPKTQAFASHVAEQGIHINAGDDLPEGILDADTADRVERELIERLFELTDPDDGLPVVDRIERRADVIRGPHVKRSPRLFPFCRDQRYELSDTLAATSPITDHRDRPWGYHHVNGVFMAAGPGIRSGALSPLDIVDILPTVLHLGGLPVPNGLDGRVADHVLGGEAASAAVETRDMTPEQSRAGDYPFSAAEESAIEESLRGLGYIE